MRSHLYYCNKAIEINIRCIHSLASPWTNFLLMVVRTFLPDMSCYRSTWSMSFLLAALFLSVKSYLRPSCYSLSVEPKRCINTYGIPIFSVSEIETASTFRNQHFRLPTTPSPQLVATNCTSNAFTNQLSNARQGLSVSTIATRYPLFVAYWWPDIGLHAQSIASF